MLFKIASDIVLGESANQFAKRSFDTFKSDFMGLGHTFQGQRDKEKSAKLAGKIETTSNLRRFNVAQSQTLTNST